MSDNALKSKSKLLSLILRHQPEKAGLTLGTGGWVDVDDLLDGLTNMGNPMSHEFLIEIVETNDKKRFSLSTDGKRIRAAQGHSVEIEHDLTPLKPPATLYHGTATRFIDLILRDGLKPMKRQHVHLSADVETALKVGQRHGKPVILKIASDVMSADNIPFYQADNGVWLTNSVAPKYLQVETT